MSLSSLRNHVFFSMLASGALFACGVDPSGGSNDNGNGNQNLGQDSGTTGHDVAVPQDSAVQLENFSFFVTSLASLQLLSDSEDGFGGDLRYGETGNGAGLRGADKICSEIAEMSMTGAGTGKVWRAFLSTVSYDHLGNAGGVDAKDRIGEGPWYDRNGWLLAPDLDSLLNARPEDGDSRIADDFPNEWGVLNHRPDPTQPAVDNHDTLTGTDEYGELYSSTATCDDWTSSSGSTGRPRVGHSWPRDGGGGPGPGGGEMENWMSALDESGCAPGVNLIETGAPGNDGTVGSGGGYGGFYCFALTP
jgi:hypothetical protein